MDGCVGMNRRSAGPCGCSRWRSSRCRGGEAPRFPSSVFHIDAPWQHSGCVGGMCSLPVSGASTPEPPPRQVLLTLKQRRTGNRWESCLSLGGDGRTIRSRWWIDGMFDWWCVTGVMDSAGAWVNAAFIIRSHDTALSDRCGNWIWLTFLEKHFFYYYFGSKMSICDLDAIQTCWGNIEANVPWSPPGGWLQHRSLTLPPPW